MKVRALSSDVAVAASAQHGESLLWATLRHWRFLLLGLLASVALSWAVAERFGVRVWQAKATVLYSSATLPGLAQSGYAPPTTASVVSLIKTQAQLETLCEEFGLACGSRELDRQIRVVQLRNSEVIEVTLDWTDPEVGAALLNRLLALQATRMADQRREHLGRTLAALTESIAVCKARRAAAQRALDAALDNSGTVDVETERERLEKDLVSIRSAADAARVAATASADQVRELQAQLDGKGAGDTTEALLARKEFLELARAEELRVATAKRQLEAKADEITQLTVGQLKGAVSNLEVARLRAEKDVLQLQLKHAEKALGEYREAMKKLPQEAAATKLRAAKLTAREAKEKAMALEAFLASRNERSDQLAQLARSIRPHERELANADKALQGLVAEAQVADQANRGNLQALAVLTPATTAGQIITSNRGRLLALTFALSMLTLGCGTVGVEYLRRARSREAAAARLGLPVIARRATEEAPEVEDRRVALRISEHIGDASVILLTSVGEGHELDRLAATLGRLLGLRGERVLLMDARVVAAAVIDVPTAQGLAGPAGLWHLLLADGIEHAQAIVPTQHPSVDLMPAGGGTAVELLPKETLVSDALTTAGGVSGADLLLGRRMTELLDWLCQKYTRVVILGPSLARPLEAELMMAHADSVLITLGSDDQVIPKSVVDQVKTLAACGAPLAGSVLA